MTDHDERRPIRASAGRTMTSAEACGYSEEGDTWRPRVHSGMYVIGSDDVEIGQVRETRQGDFLVLRSGTDGGLAYVPFDAIRDLVGDRILLDIPSDRIDAEGP